MEQQSEMQEKLEEARRNLKKKFGNTRTGGKGTMRRKIKKKSHIIVTKLSEKEKDYNKTIDSINESITNIDGNHNELWNTYLEDDWLFDIISQLRKKDFPKNDIFDFLSVPFPLIPYDFALIRFYCPIYGQNTLEKAHGCGTSDPFVTY